MRVLFSVAMVRRNTRKWWGTNDQELADEIKKAVVKRVEAALIKPRKADCPNACLCHNVDEKRVATLVNKFSDDTYWPHGVYVLECRPRTVSQRVVREELKLQNKSRWTERAQQHKRMLYVGVSKNVVKRVKQHAYADGAGANFTQMFPATRLLSVKWYPAKSTAYRAEEITSELLEKATDDNVYISQPG